MKSSRLSLPLFPAASVTFFCSSKVQKQAGEFLHPLTPDDFDSRETCNLQNKSRRGGANLTAWMMRNNSTEFRGQMSAATKLRVDGQEEKRPYKPGSGGKSIHPPRPQKLLTYVRMFQQTADSRLPLQFLVICEQRKVKGQRQNQQVWHAGHQTAVKGNAGTETSFIAALFSRRDFSTDVASINNNE